MLTNRPNGKYLKHAANALGKLGTQTGSSTEVDVIRLEDRLSLETFQDFISVSTWIDLLPVCASVDLAICQVKM